MNENEKTVAAEGDQVETATPKKKRSMDIVALVLCLVIALSIWIYVENTARTEIKRDITLTVDVAGQIYEATEMTIFSNIEGTDYENYQITITVEGMENVLDKYSNDDYKIKIKTEDIQGGAVQTVTFDVIMPSNEITLDAAPRLDSIYIDKEAQKILTVEKNEIAVSYKNANVGKQTEIFATPITETLVISGPERTVNKISKAEVTADILGVNTSKKFMSEDVKFLDSAGNPIVTTYITLDKSAVEIDLKICDEREFGISVSPNSVIEGEYMYELTIVDGAKIVLNGDTSLMPPEGGNFVIMFEKDKLTSVTSDVTPGKIKLKDIALADGLELGEGTENVEISYYITRKAITIKTGEDS